MRRARVSHEFTERERPDLSPLGRAMQSRWPDTMEVRVAVVAAPATLDLAYALRQAAARGVLLCSPAVQVAPGELVALEYERLRMPRGEDYDDRGMPR